MQPKHQKVTTYSKQDDGSTLIQQKSYYEKLSQVVEEVEKSTKTSSMTLEQDVLHALGHITHDGAAKLTLTIDTKNGEPSRIVKRYVTFKQSLGRL